MAVSGHSGNIHVNLNTDVQAGGNDGLFLSLTPRLWALSGDDVCAVPSGDRRVRIELRASRDSGLDLGSVFNAPAGGTSGTTLASDFTTDGTTTPLHPGDTIAAANKSGQVPGHWTVLSVSTTHLLVEFAQPVSDSECTGFNTATLNVEFSRTGATPRQVLTLQAYLHQSPADFQGDNSSPSLFYSDDWFKAYGPSALIPTHP
ncbi:hypothetical protein [Actinomyces faecalis]|nr:hypothetical protein [Actinomyces faecalis]